MHYLNLPCFINFVSQVKEMSRS